LILNNLRAGVNLTAAHNESVICMAPAESGDSSNHERNNSRSRYWLSVRKLWPSLSGSW